MSTTTVTETSNAGHTNGKIEATKPSSDAALNFRVGTDEAPKALHVIPKFTDKYEERRWAKNHMAAAFRTLARLGWADGASGHISLRDPVSPELFWINPYALHFALIKASDLILVDHEGRPQQPTTRKVNAAGFIIHSSIHRARPDINAVCHMHSPYGRAWSTFGRGIEMLNQDSCMFYKNLGVYKSFGGVVFAPDEGKRMAEAMGSKNKSLILQNHGLITGGDTVDEAAAAFIALERACQAQILADSAAANGIPKNFVGDEVADYTYECTGTPACMFMQFAPEYDLTVELCNGSFLE